MTTTKDINIIRDLAKQAAEISQKDIQNEKRDLWRQHNSLKKTRPLVLVSVGRYDCYATEILPPDKLQCQDPFFRNHEFTLRNMIFKDSIGDDSITEPWITVQAVYKVSGWGPSIKHIPSSKAGGAYKFDPAIKEPEDIAKLVKPHHVIDEINTARNRDRLMDAVGDILEVNVDRGPIFRSFSADISYGIVQLIGLEQLMWYMYDRPKWLHEILAFMRDGILTVHEEAETAGDWGLCNHENQAQAYAAELPDPKANSKSIGRDQLWAFFAAQEYAQISPEMHDEFLLQYQIPIMEKFGLTAYGCCEDLTRKISILKKIPNLRRIAVTPWANVAECAEQIGQDYVI